MSSYDIQIFWRAHPDWAPGEPELIEGATDFNVAEGFFVIRRPDGLVRYVPFVSVHEVTLLFKQVVP